RVLNAFIVLEIDNNAKLRVILANPARMVRFRALNCHQITTSLNDVMCRRLLDLVSGSIDKSTLPYAASALTLLQRIKDGFVHWAEQDSGENVFHRIVVPGFDATGANLMRAYFHQANFTGANFTSANLSGTVFSSVNFMGVSFGQLPFLEEHKREVTAITQSRDGNVTITADSTGVIILRNREKVISLNMLSTIYALAFSPDERQFVFAGACLKSQNADLSASEELDEILGADIESEGMISRYLIYAYNIDVATLACEKRWEACAHAKQIRSIVYTADGTQLLSASEDAKLKIFSSDTGEFIKVFPDVVSSISSLALHTNKITLASGDSDGSITIWNIHHPKRNRELTIQAHRGNVNHVAFSSNGHYLVSGGKDKCVKVWNFRKKYACEHTLEGHSEVVSCVAISPDNKLVFSADDAEYKGKPSLIVWDLNTGEKLQQFGCESGILSIAIDHGKNTHNDQPVWVVLAACRDSKVRRFIVNPKSFCIKPDRADYKIMLDVTGVDILNPINLSEENATLLRQMNVAIRLSTTSNSFFAETDDQPLEEVREKSSEISSADIPSNNDFVQNM
nr:WD40 repeat domain-containing protein [Pseudomonadota bacterium]